ncbi:DNA-binding transcriptional LysR family regulator [Psychromicrobium silvestre]|uniref:DNA-binding transcriptional LysR family regulator n=1 Tax=Psychromicrobium silvestre TaxID=1645614 RepID=A0A7Y9S637_9MICC|nr:LysR family transcriptional regulator [Psychromicrobium silvestre]NYE93907.1 DNA-binding transcriptional LysR family regulator [Psychromicrobium silvestre]
MNFEQLRGFDTVARLGHFTRAAEELHLAQPSLSRQIATLEHDLGVGLFHRVRGHITLTAAGETLLPLARRMLADAESARREMAELIGLRRGRVRLGATPTLCVSLVAEVLSAFRTAHPGIELQLTERGSRGLTEELNEGALDLALITATESGRPTTASLNRTPLLTEELVVISSASQRPLSSGGTISLSELSRLPQIVFSESYDLRTTTDQAFRNAGLTPVVALEGAEMDAVLRFVERGMGVAVVPAMVLLDRPLLSSTRLTEPHLSRTISIASRADVQATHAAAAMQKLITATARALTASGAPLAHLLSNASRSS